MLGGWLASVLLLVTLIVTLIVTLMAIAQTLSRESPRYHFKHLDLVEMPLRFHKVPLTRCRRMGIPNAPPHVQAIRNYPDSSRGCARVSIEVMCEVQVFDDNSVQVFDDNSVQAFDDNRDDHLRWVPLEDPVLLAWAYGPRSGVGGIDGTLMEARVEHSREQTQSPTGQFSVRFDTCTAGRHAVHVRLEYLSRNHTIAEQSVPGAHNLHYLPPEIIMRKADGSPYAVDVTLPETPPMHISPSPSSADNRPACELGLEHAPQWKNPPGSRSPLMSQLRASFRWSDAASTLEEAMQYHTTHSSKTRRFSTVFHMGHTHAVRKTLGNNLEESPSLQQLAADSGLAPYPDGRGGFYKKAYETNNVDAWFTELPRFQPWDRFEAAPSSPCRLCRYDFDDAMKCANKRPMISAGTDHSLALRRDGRIACWGRNNYGEAPPAGVDGDFVAIAAGLCHSLALRRDGRIACWGRNDDGQAPPDGVDGDFVAIAAGALHSLALRRNGNVACWGCNGAGRAPPDGVDGDFVAIAAGVRHSLALRRDGSMACWGDNYFAQAPPAGVAGPFVTQEL